MRLKHLLELDDNLDLGGIPAENPETPAPGEVQNTAAPRPDNQQGGGLADPVDDGLGDLEGDLDIEPEIERDIGDLVSHPYMDWETSGENQPMELAKATKEDLNRIQGDAEDRMVAIAAEEPSGLYLNNEYRRLRDMVDFIDQLKAKEAKES